MAQPLILPWPILRPRDLFPPLPPPFQADPSPMEKMDRLYLCLSRDMAITETDGSWWNSENSCTNTQSKSLDVNYTDRQIQVVEEHPKPSSIIPLAEVYGWTTGGPEALVYKWGLSNRHSCYNVYLCYFLPCEPRHWQRTL